MRTILKTIQNYPKVSQASAGQIVIDKYLPFRSQLWHELKGNKEPHGHDDDAPKHDKLHGLSPGDCHAAPPLPPPTKPSVSLSSEIGEHNINKDCCSSLSAALARVIDAVREKLEESSDEANTLA